MEPQERDLLAKRFQEEKENSGLLDMKFFLGDVSDCVVDDVCQEVNHLYELAEKGQCRPVPSWGDRRVLPRSL